MKKRDFIKSTVLVAGTPAAAIGATANRLYGTPGSVIPIAPTKADRIKLSLAKMDIPPAAWDMMVNYFGAVEEVGGSKEHRERFLADPGQYLLSRGLSPDVVKPDSLDVGLLKVAGDPIARSSASEGNYTLFLHRLKELQVTAPPGPSDLSKKIAQLLRDNINAYSAVRLAFSGNSHFAQDEPAFVAASYDEAESLLAQSDDSDGDGYESEAYLSTSISVYTNVMAATNVAAVTQAGAAVAAYLLVAVAVTAVAVVLAAGTNSPGVGRLAKLDPNLFDAAGRASTAARLLGNKAFEVNIVKDLLRQEVTALYEAAESVGIIKLKPRYKEMAIAAALEHAHKGLGLNHDGYSNYRSRIGPKSRKGLA